MGDGIWEMEDGRWKMGDGRWDMGWELLPSLGLYSPEGASPIFNLPYPMLSSKEQKRGSFRVFICFLEGGNWKFGDGMRTATVSWIIQPGGRISYIQSSISDAFVEGTKKGSFRACH
jgi:hypothetical protein